jgi:hypothetical protein
VRGLSAGDHAALEDVRRRSPTPRTDRRAAAVIGTGCVTLVTTPKSNLRAAGRQWINEVYFDVRIARRIKRTVGIPLTRQWTGYRQEKAAASLH